MRALCRVGPGACWHVIGALVVSRRLLREFRGLLSSALGLAVGKRVEVGKPTTSSVEETGGFSLREAGSRPAKEP